MLSRSWNRLSSLYKKRMAIRVSNPACIVENGSKTSLRRSVWPPNFTGESSAYCGFSRLAPAEGLSSKTPFQNPLSRNGDRNGASKNGSSNGSLSNIDRCISFIIAKGELCPKNWRKISLGSRNTKLCRRGRSCLGTDLPVFGLYSKGRSVPEISMSKSKSPSES